MKHSTLIAFGTQDGGDSRVQKNEWNESHALEADENFVSDAELAILQATSGSNTGDQAAGDFNHDDLASITGTAGQYNHPTDAQIAGLHAESHTVASHSDTTATGAELEELTDGSETTLHSHAGGGGGATVFTDLTDTPSAYTSKAGYMPVVNSGETALEFVTAVQAFDGGSFGDTYSDTVDFDGGAF